METFDLLILFRKNSLCRHSHKRKQSFHHIKMEDVVTESAEEETLLADHGGADKVLDIDRKLNSTKKEPLGNIFQTGSLVLRR